MIDKFVIGKTADGAEYIGDMYHDSRNDSYRYEQKTFTPAAETWNIATNAKLSSKIFRDTLYHTRVFPPNRVDAREMLRRLNLFDYDPWQIMLKSHFIAQDFCWAHEEYCPEWFWTNHYKAAWHPDYVKVTGKEPYVAILDLDEGSIY